MVGSSTQAIRRIVSRYFIAAAGARPPERRPGRAPQQSVDAKSGAPACLVAGHQQQHELLPTVVVSREIPSWGSCNPEAIRKSATRVDHASRGGPQCREISRCCSRRRVPPCGYSIPGLEWRLVHSGMGVCQGITERPTFAFDPFADPGDLTAVSLRAMSIAIALTRDIAGNQYPTSRRAILVKARTRGGDGFCFIIELANSCGANA